MPPHPLLLFYSPPPSAHAHVLGRYKLAALNCNSGNYTHRIAVTAAVENMKEQLQLLTKSDKRRSSFNYTHVQEAATGPPPAYQSVQASSSTSSERQVGDHNNIHHDFVTIFFKT